MIRTALSRNFYCIVHSRAVGSLLLMTPCVAFFDYDLIGIRDDRILISFLISLSLSLAAWWFNKERKRPVRESRNYAYLLNGTPGLSFHLLEVVSWIFYLIPYEYLIRGMVLTYLSGKFSPIFSVMLNCSLYAFIHVQQGLREVLGAFLFGLLLCGATLITGNFWSAFIIHLMFALSNSFVVLRNNEWVLIQNKL